MKPIGRDIGDAGAPQGKQLVAAHGGGVLTPETPHYPDTTHHAGDPKRPSMVLNPGHLFNSTTTNKFTTAGPWFRHNF